METIQRFRAAVAERDLGALKDLLAPGVRFFTPARATPIEARAAVLAAFGVLVRRVFEDFQCVGEVNGTAENSTGAKASTHILIFRTRVSGKVAHGIYLIQLDENGVIDELTVMVRPQAAVDALGEAVLGRLWVEGRSLARSVG